jgi:hypothetical protein
MFEVFTGAALMVEVAKRTEAEIKAAAMNFLPANFKNDCFIIIVVLI